MSALKGDLLHFQEQFLALNPNLHDTESNWLNFKHFLAASINLNIPKRFPKSNRQLPWVTYQIICKMKQRKQLYDKAKHYQIEEAWAGYRKL